MSLITTGSVRKWVTLGMTLVLAASLVTWFFRRETLPPQIRIAAGSEGGMYETLGLAISNPLKDHLGRAVTTRTTDGSQENLRQLVDGEVDLAIVQGGAVSIEEVSVITPLFREFVFVVARKGTKIQNVGDLEGRDVCLGPSGSGNRDAALAVLGYFGLEERDVNANDLHPIEALSDDESIEAAIITAGAQHPDLQELMSSHKFEIVPIPSAEAMELVRPFLRKVEIPRGLFARHPAVPSEPIPTIATTAFLVCRNDAPPALVDAALETIHEGSLRLEFPTLIPRQEAPQWIETRLHSTAQRYFNPADSIGAVKNVMESLVATKELLFALGAGIYLLWTRWRRLKEKELQLLVDRQKEHLDRLLMETLRIERAQMQIDDVEQLQTYLDNVTRIKLRALQELTEEELRGNQEFSIFLDQCSNLIGRMQLKILLQQSTKENI